MNLAKRIYERIKRYLISRLSLDMLKSRLSQRRGLVILCYHTVAQELADYPFRTDIKALQRHFLLLQETFDILPLDEAVRLLEAGEISSHSKPVVAVTFDDGFKDNLTHVTPLLETFKIPATLFVAKSHIDTDGITYLNTKELVQLAQHPLWSVGAHAVSHNSLYSFLPSDLEKELVDCKQWLKDLLGKAPEIFAYPQGKFSRRVIEAVRPHFSHAFGTGKRIGSSYDTHQILRVCPSVAEDDLRAFARMLLSTPWEGQR